MTMQRIVLLNLALLVVLAAGGYMRSRAALGGERGQMPPATFGDPGAPAEAARPASVPGTAPESSSRESSSRESRVGEREEPGTIQQPEAEVVHDESLAVSSADQLADGLRPLERTVNVLLLGSDRRPDQYDWRTDVLMILALDLESGQAGAISFPRDIFLEEIPGQIGRAHV